MFTHFRSLFQKKKSPHKLENLDINLVTKQLIPYIEWKDLTRLKTCNKTLSKWPAKFVEDLKTQRSSGQQAALKNQFIVVNRLLEKIEQEMRDKQGSNWNFKNVMTGVGISASAALIGVAATYVAPAVQKINDLTTAINNYPLPNQHGTTCGEVHLQVNSCVNDQNTLSGYCKTLCDELDNQNWIVGGVFMAFIFGAAGFIKFSCRLNARLNKMATDRLNIPNSSIDEFSSIAQADYETLCELDLLPVTYNGWILTIEQIVKLARDLQIKLYDKLFRREEKQEVVELLEIRCER